jgi:hypothetical protein
MGWVFAPTPFPACIPSPFGKLRAGSARGSPSEWDSLQEGVRQGDG